MGKCDGRLNPLGAMNMKKIVWILVILIFHFSIGVSREDPEEMPDVPSIEGMDNPDGWPIFLIALDHDFIEIRFPTEPFLEDYGNKWAYTAVDTSALPTAVYGLTFYKQPTFPEDPLEIFNQVIDQRSQANSMLISKRITQDIDCYILDVISKTKDLKVFRKDRVIVTNQNVFSLSTIFFPHSPENHAYFIKSFNPEF